MQTHCDERRPTGMRGISEDSLRAQDLASRFEGLREGVAKGQVLAAFKQAAGVLCIRQRHIFAIDKLMGFSFAQDWGAGKRPVVWPSNERLQEELGLSRRMVQYTLRQLVDLRLIVPVDSPTGKRYGRRDGKGNIAEAYGFDLSPLGVRYAEFTDAAERADVMRKARGKLRRQIGVARRAICQIAAAAIEDRLDGGDWADWAQEAREIASRGAVQASLENLRHLLLALEDRRQIAERALRSCLLSADKASSAAGQAREKPVCSSPMGAMDCARSTTTTDLKINKLVESRKNPSGESRRLVQAWKQQDSQRKIGQVVQSGFPMMVEEQMTQYRVTPELVSYACPELNIALSGERVTWDHILEAAYLHKGTMRISDSIWGEACRIMGREGAAATMAIVAAKRDSLRSPGGYFRGMVKKAGSGQLNLGPTLYALRDIRDGGGGD